ncbi:Cupredoxin [Lipomyces orientalis]|uniref:Cupredoxin n=1 Tax=Lipomyces orientalis TaxID=1233043 RepID=A0ACC3U1T4_9ASCO
MKLLYGIHIALLAGTALSFTVHEVVIRGLSFNPNSVTAATGDYVRFTFEAGPHGVAQAAFDSPCQPLSSPSSGNDVVFFSGIMTPSGSNSPTFTIEINSTDPLWFYCPVDGHCEGGMVGAINPTSDETVDDFASAAAQVSSSSAPSEPAGDVAIESSSISSSAIPSSTSMSSSATTSKSASTSMSASGTAESITTMTSATTSSTGVAAVTTSGAGTLAINAAALLVAGALVFARILA